MNASRHCLPEACAAAIQCADAAALQVLRELQEAVRERLAGAERAVRLSGIAGHLARRAPLPTHHLAQDSADYIVEWLDLGIRNS